LAELAAFICEHDNAACDRETDEDFAETGRLRQMMEEVLWSGTNSEFWKSALAFNDSAHKLSSVTETKCEIRLGDCREVLREYPDTFFDLIVTSPPYADSRARTYGGIKPSDYVDWFLQRTGEFLRVLKASGTFALNIE
jgi:hypothetical protein